jgi:FlaA1/EpsC-like NDP-sugar epimerase
MSQQWSMHKILRSLKHISRSHILTDLALMVVAAHISLFLRLKPVEAVDYLLTLYKFLPVILSIRVLAMAYFGCYQVIWRFVSTVDALRLAQAIGTALVITITTTFFLPETILRLPRSVYLIEAILSVLLLTGVRLARRLAFERQESKEAPSTRCTIIYGAGNNGRTLAARFRSDRALGVEVIGFIDDDPEKQNASINGIPVLGSHEDLRDILDTHNVQQFVIALPNLPSEVLREVTLITRDFNLIPKITTRLSQGAESAQKNITIYRDIELSDLLHRPRHDIDLGKVRQLIRGQTVLVTGAGGSIGSEIARQILSHDPAKLLLLDHSEYALYEIDKELRASTNDFERVVPLLVDLKDFAQMERIIQNYSPDIVYHAAAYKHVHLVENNPGSAIMNNVAGTQNLLESCARSKVHTFVLISTDKAVNPAGVMGATKRVCELLTSAYAAETGRRFCAVRFGNVLGSSGSLIPLLQKQIREGGPVTITHPDMTRFFMLIPEAVSLVLMSSTLARPGDIHVLKMGDPVKILDIARSLMSLMGVNEKQVPIVFTGVRPGEKMFEELYIRGDELTTDHPDILTLPHGDAAATLNPNDRRQMRERVQRLLECAGLGHPQMLAELNTLVKSSYFADIHNLPLA